MVEVPISKVVPDYDSKWITATNAALATVTNAIHPVYSPFAQRQAPHIGPYNNEDVTNSKVKPGSPGFLPQHFGSNEWLNSAQRRDQREHVSHVANRRYQYSMYNINITTNVNVYNTAKAANVLRTGIINFVNQDGRSNAPLSAFEYHICWHGLSQSGIRF